MNRGEEGHGVALQGKHSGSGVNYTTATGGYRMWPVGVGKGHYNMGGIWVLYCIGRQSWNITKGT